MLCTCNRSSSSYQKKNRSSSCFLLYLAQELAHVRRQLHLKDSRCSENKQLVRRRLLSLVVKWCQILSRASNSNNAKYTPSPRPEWTNGMKRTQIRNICLCLCRCVAYLRPATMPFRGVSLRARYCRHALSPTHSPTPRP